MVALPRVQDVFLNAYPVFLFILVAFAAFGWTDRFLFEVQGYVFDRKKGITTNNALFKGVINEFQLLLKEGVSNFGLVVCLYDLRFRSEVVLVRRAAVLHAHMEARASPICPSLHILISSVCMMVYEGNMERLRTNLHRKLIKTNNPFFQEQLDFKNDILEESIVFGYTFYPVKDISLHLKQENQHNHKQRSLQGCHK